MAAAAASPRLQSAPGVADRLATEFQDLDDDSCFYRSLERLRDEKTRNFVVRYNASEAKVAFDLEAMQFDSVLAAQESTPHEPQWINIFAPNVQKSAISAIARHYDLSPRLLAIISSDVDTPISADIASPESPRLESPRLSLRRAWHQRRTDATHSIRGSLDARGSVDVELGPDKAFPMTRRTSILEPWEELIDVNHYQMANDLWHFASADTGKKYICLGYNTLHGDFREDTAQDRDIPKGKRLWSWLLLCHDSTVISIHEDPFPQQGDKPLSTQQRQILLTCRRNIVNVLRHLSRAKAAHVVHHPLLVLRLRRSADLPGSEIPQSEEHFIAEHGPSLLFYYLFDDWFTGYALVTHREHQYGARLKRLREQMLHKADLSYIEELHHIGRELTVLRRIYQAYKQLITQLLEIQKTRKQQLRVAEEILHQRGGPEPILSPPLDAVAAAAAAAGSGQPLQSCIESLGAIAPNTVGPVLTSEAVSRFERLRIRIESYVLSEIQECLGEKDTMAFMNFNLIAVKDSQAVERLTRITILLAKVTVIFLPVSLMTAYFSTQIKDVVFTRKAYWIGFGITTLLSIVFLVFFGIFSDTVESTIIYKPLSRWMLDRAKALYGRVRPQKGPASP